MGIFVRMLQQRRGRRVEHNGDIGMKLEDGGRALRRNRAGDHGLDRFRLVGAGGNQHDRFRLHDRPNAHAESLPRHLIGAGEETGIGLNGTLGKIHHVRDRRKGIGRLIESNVTVAPNSQNLQAFS